MTTKQSSESILDLRRFKRQLKSSFWIYLVSFLFFMSLGVAFWFIKGDKYHTYARVLVEPKQGSGMGALGQVAGMMKAFSVGGIGSSNTNNELMLMTSREVLDSTIHNLGLNFTNIEKVGLKKKLLWDDEVMVGVEIPQQMLDTLSQGFKINVDLMGGKADVSVTRGGRFRKKTLWEGENLTLPAKINTPVGELLLSQTEHFRPDAEAHSYMIFVQGTPSAAEEMRKKLSIGIIDKMADAVEYEYVSNNTSFNEDLLNHLVWEYEQKRLEQKNKDARNDVEFYNARLESLSGEMAEADSKLEKYKNDNKIVAIEAEAQILASSKVANKQEIASAQAELAYYQRILHTLSRDDKGMVTLPTMENMQNPMIEQYNNALLEKRQLEVSAKEDNPTLVNLNKSIQDMRTALIKNISLVVNSSELKLKSLYGLDGEAESRLSKMPGFEKEYVNLLRDKTIKDELYLFLMERRESAMLDLTSNSTPAFVVDHAYSDVKADKILKLVVLVVCFLLSFFVATLIVIWRMQKKDTLKDKMDFASFGLEENCFVCDKDHDPSSEIRIELTKDKNERVSFVAFYPNDDMECIENLKAAFERAGKNLSLHEVTDNPGFAHSNDTLENDAYLSKIKSETANDGYALIQVPEKERLAVIREVLENESAHLLLVIKSGVFTRSYFKSLVQKLSADRLIVCLTY